MAKGDHKQDDRRRRIKAGVVARDVSARLMRSEKTAETLLKERRYDVLGEIFESITVYSSAWSLSGVRILTGSVRSIIRS